jgi:hypothetical protein
MSSPKYSCRLKQCSGIRRLAKRRGVFKVETIEIATLLCAEYPRHRNTTCSNHGSLLHEPFFPRCTLTQELEVVLGPDTTDLAFRVGLHSGPVTEECSVVITHDSSYSVTR